MRTNSFVPALLLAATMLSAGAHAQQTETPGSPGVPTSQSTAGTQTPTAANSASDIIVTARRLDLAREALLPSLGANKYTLDAVALTAQPGGLERGFNDVLLTTPGVTQDNFGAVHVRNEHANLQYRINGIIVPEPVTGFGQVIDTRLADSVSLISGALPAQYGYRTAGVVDIRSKSGQLADQATAGIYGGSYGLIQPSFTLQGSRGPVSGFGSLTFTRNDLGIENPREGRQAFHDRAETVKGFAYVSDILTPNDRVTGIFGLYEGRFQIPNVPGGAPDFTLNGLSDFDSLRLNQRQRENNYYGTVALQHSNGDFDVQIAPFFRLSRTRFYPDNTGDLILNGTSARSRLSSDVFGVQVDGRYKVSDHHTLRYGMFFQNETSHANVDTLVFPASDAGLTPADCPFADPASLPQPGCQASSTPFNINDRARKTGQLYGIYAQDEWAPLDGLTINFGGRFDRVRAYTNEQQFSPRINAVYKLSDAAAVHLGYARTFTPPPQELVAQAAVAQFNGTTGQSAITVGDPVKAEREHLLDAGVALTPLQGLNVTVDGYYKFKRNLLDEGQFGEALVLAPFNYQTAYNYGIELGTNYRTGRLALYGNVALGAEKAKNIVSSQFFFARDELDFISRNYIFTDHNQTVTASAGASYGYRNPLGTLTGSLDAFYGSGERKGGAVPNGDHVPEYVQVNLGLSQAFDGPGVLKGFTLRFDIVNVGDQSYLIRDGSGVGVGAPSFGPRRQFLFGISKAFG